jgi:hypothetical protein
LAVIENQNDSFTTLSKSYIQELLSAIALRIQPDDADFKPFRVSV